MLTAKGTETDHAVAARQPCAAGGGGGLWDRKGAGRSHFTGQGNHENVR